jgi:hypothetical protein
LEPPGVNGTMMRMVLLGKPCARAGDVPLGETKAITAMMHAAHSRVILVFLRRGDRLEIIEIWPLGK